MFAVVAVASHTFETWFSSLEARAGSDTPVTVRLPARYFRITMLRSEFHYLSTTSSSCPHLVARGTRLKRGGECTELVRAFESNRRSRSPLQLGGLFVFYLSIGLVLSAFMRYKDMGRSRQLRAHATVFLLMAVLVVSAKALLLMTGFSAVVLPVATLPLLVTYFFSKRIAFVVAVTSALTTASLVNFDIELFIIYLFSGLAVAAARGHQHRAWVQLKRGALASWVALVTTVVTTLIFSGTLGIYDDLTEHIDPRYSIWISAILSGITSGVLSFFLTPVVGNLVGEVSRNTLLDLQDLNQRLLGLLRERAPGTWEHSRAMANLAEAATNAIGGNALLARIGAYYHDVGKMGGADYFIENQAGGPNPHDDLSPYESTGKIHRHVVEGARLLRKEGLPEDVVEFCYSHHGSSLLEFFWHKNMAQGNAEDLAEEDFRYPGHKPTTRETGILMIVDAVEAAARTVDAPDKAAFQTLTQQILFTKLSQGQLDETGLTVADLRVIANTLVDTLVNMYHARIKYPWQTSDTGRISRTTPVPGDTDPVPSDTTPVPSDTAPVPSDTTPVPNDTAPVPSDTTPVPSDTTPVPSDTDPVPSDTDPVPSDNADKGPPGTEVEDTLLIGDDAPAESQSAPLDSPPRRTTIPLEPEEKKSEKKGDAPPE